MSGSCFIRYANEIRFYKRELRLFSGYSAFSSYFYPKETKGIERELKNVLKMRKLIFCMVIYPNSFVKDSNVFNAGNLLAAFFVLLVNILSNLNVLQL